MNTPATDVTRQLVDALAEVGEGRIELSKLVEVIDQWQSDQAHRGKNAMVSSNHVSPTHQRALRGRGAYLAVLSLAVRLEELLRPVRPLEPVD